MLHLVFNALYSLVNSKKTSFSVFTQRWAMRKPRDRDTRPWDRSKIDHSPNLSKSFSSLPATLTLLALPTIFVSSANMATKPSISSFRSLIYKLKSSVSNTNPCWTSLSHWQPTRKGPLYFHWQSLSMLEPCLYYHGLLSYYKPHMRT